LPGIAGGGWLTAGLKALVHEAPGIEVVCAARSWPVPEAFVADGVRYVAWPGTPPASRWLGVLRAWTDGLRDRPPVEEIRRIIDDVRPDLVHVHGTETPNALAALLAAGPSGTPVLVSIQGLVSEIAPLFLTGLRASDLAADAATTEFLKGRGVLHAWRRMRRAAAMERRALAHVRYVSGRTAWDRQAVLQASPRACYWHVDEALRPPFGDTAWRGGGADAPVILAVASSAPYKGIDVLLRAFATVRKARPARLCVVGEIVGTPLWRSLHRLETDLGLQGHVEWVGGSAAAELAAAMSTCNVFVCASRIENSSNGVCEAMLVGAPVIASRVGGIPSLIADGVDGLLFPSGDHAALATAVERVLDDADLARALGRAARARAVARHDPSAIGRALTDAYAGVLADVRASAAGDGGPA
jgi:glycosyltransferase involved in cell wall biosynthesis